MEPGKLYGLGVGPGDSELLTLKAVRLLQSADVIAYPAPEAGDSLARSIAAPHFKGGQIEYAIRLPMDIQRHPAQNIYAQAAKDIADHLKAGRCVVVLCEGDPFLFGSFMYLYQRLINRFDIEVVPGVTSVVAAAARVGKPLVEREEGFIVLPATLPTAELLSRFQSAEAISILKVGRHFPRIRAILEIAGLAGDALIICHATMDQEQQYQLIDPTLTNLPYFSIILAWRRRK